MVVEMYKYDCNGRNLGSGLTASLPRLYQQCKQPFSSSSTIRKKNRKIAHRTHGCFVKEVWRKLIEKEPNKPVASSARDQKRDLSHDPYQSLGIN
mmetsp:Transcript_10738/g.20079  ORF Transcript_10738/g.20079 Transcript_10738/m.20079 type:complete len:95 (-) Transcript_10738:4605-4889(-)